MIRWHVGTARWNAITWRRLTGSVFSSATNMADKKKKPDLGLLEEDDEFEEFPAQGYNIINSCFDKTVFHKYVL